VTGSPALDNQVLTTMLLKMIAENKLLVVKVSTLEGKLEECMVRLAKIEDVVGKFDAKEDMFIKRLELHEDQRETVEKINNLRIQSFMELSKKVEQHAVRVARHTSLLDELLARKPTAPAPSVVMGAAPALGAVQAVPAPDPVLVPSVVPAPAPTPAPTPAPAPTPTPASASAPAPALVVDPAPVAVGSSVPVPTTPLPAADPADESGSGAPASTLVPVAAVTIGKIGVAAGEVLCPWLKLHVDEHIRIESELSLALSDAHRVIFGRDIKDKHLRGGMDYLAFPPYSFKPEVRKMCLEGRAPWDESCFEIGTSVIGYKKDRDDSTPHDAGKPDTPNEIWQLLLGVFLLCDYPVCKEILALVEIRE
jgi:hypothetical protein